jgi:hypothetical protein
MRNEAALRFAFFRVALGLLLAVNLLLLLPWVSELYGPEIFTVPLIPKSLLFDPAGLAALSTNSFQTIIALGIGLALAFAAGICRRFAAPLLFAVLWLLEQRNPLASTPDAALLRWLLLATCFVPAGEPFRFSWSTKATNGIPRELPSELTFEVPGALERSVWILLSLAYCFAGFHKIFRGDPSWLSGEAVRWLFTDSSPRRLWYGENFSLMPIWLSALLTWFTLLAQLSGPVCIWFARPRRWWWWSVFLLEASSILFLDVGAIALGMLVAQIFVFNPFLNLGMSRQALSHQR